MVNSDGGCVYIDWIASNLSWFFAACPNYLPSVLNMIKRIWSKWKSVAEKIGAFQMNLIFSILYYLLILPVGVTMNYFKDFLDLKTFPKWQKVEDNSSSLNKLKEQY